RHSREAGPHRLKRLLETCHLSMARRCRPSGCSCLGRTLRGEGHWLPFLAPKPQKDYVKSQGTRFRRLLSRSRAFSEALCEALRRALSALTDSASLSERPPPADTSRSR